MSRPTSLRLPEDVRARLDDESQRISAPPSTLAVELIDEGLKMRRFPGIVVREGPTGRRAGLAKGPDVWEVVRDLKRAHGTGRQPVDFVAEETSLAPELIGLAADYYASRPTPESRRNCGSSLIAASACSRREVVARRGVPARGCCRIAATGPRRPQRRWLSVGGHRRRASLRVGRR